MQYLLTLMRLAVFDNLANNAYIQVKCFRREGISADLILDPRDRFAISDPRWEELDLCVPSERLDRDQLPEWPEEPQWVRREPRLPLQGRWNRLSIARGGMRIPGKVFQAARLGGRHGAVVCMDRSWVIRTLTEYDLVLAWGLGPAYCALAGTRFFSQSWGGDLTILPFADSDGYEGAGSGSTASLSAVEKALAPLQRWGLEHAEGLLLGDPRYDEWVDRLGLTGKVVPVMNTLVDTDRYSPGDETQLRRSVLRTDDEVLLFAPSRQDWYWKGSDAMIRAIALLAASGESVRLVCAGWGADLDRSRALAVSLGVSERMVFLPYAMSKRRLARWYRAADVVLDQFSLGSYGTSALEAMSCGKPLITYLDETRFGGRFSRPPVISAKQDVEIADAVRRLLCDETARLDAGSRSRSWVVETHGPPAARTLLRSIGAKP